MVATAVVASAVVAVLSVGNIACQWSGMRGRITSTISDPDARDVSRIVTGEGVSGRRYPVLKGLWCELRTA